MRELGIEVLGVQLLRRSYLPLTLTLTLPLPLPLTLPLTLTLTRCSACSCSGRTCPLRTRRRSCAAPRRG